MSFKFDDQVEVRELLCSLELYLVKKDYAQGFTENVMETWKEVFASEGLTFEDRLSSPTLWNMVKSYEKTSIENPEKFPMAARTAARIMCDHAKKIFTPKVLKS